MRKKMRKKTDNSVGGLQRKVELRRYFLQKYHTKKLPKVLDCCQGEGLVWKEIRKEFELGSYWGVDIKKKKGRLKLESERILQQSGWDEDVIDVDTYGSPLKHYESMLPNVTKPMTVFLTFGFNVGFDGISIKLPTIALEAIGFGRLVRRIPTSFHIHLWELSMRYSLFRCRAFGLKMVEIGMVKAGMGNNSRYVGLRLQPKETRR